MSLQNHTKIKNFTSIPVERDKALSDSIQQIDDRLATLALHLHVRAIQLREQIDVGHNLKMELFGK